MKLYQHKRNPDWVVSEDYLNECHCSGMDIDSEAPKWEYLGDKELSIKNPESSDPPNKGDIIRNCRDNDLLIVLSKEVRYGTCYENCCLKTKPLKCACYKNCIIRVKPLKAGAKPHIIIWEDHHAFFRIVPIEELHSPHPIQ